MAKHRNRASYTIFSGTSLSEKSGGDSIITSSGPISIRPGFSTKTRIKSLLKQKVSQFYIQMCVCVCVCVCITNHYFENVAPPSH